MQLDYSNIGKTTDFSVEDYTLNMGSLGSDILGCSSIGHPHWYKPRPENIDIPVVTREDVREAYYKVTRNLNTVIDQRKSAVEDKRIIPPTPDWVDRYAPPESEYDGEKFLLTRSQLAESLLHLHGNKFKFNRWNERGIWEDRRYLTLIYNLVWPKVYFMCGRQVEKSQTLCNIMVTSSVATPYYKSLYVSPSIIQTSTFSSEKLKSAIEDSPLIKDYFVNSKCRTQIFDKSFTNGSYMFLRSAYYNADRARGISAHLFCGDEIQDQLPSNLEVISECLSHAAFPRWIYACTPKTLDNTASIYWENSRKGEWHVPCSRHGTPKDPSSWYWKPLSMDNIGEKFLMCRKCHHQIDPRFGRWEWTGNPKADWAGFRISQLMAPWIPWMPDEDDPNQPDSILGKLRAYGQVRFFNEVLGLPYDDSEKPVTRGELRNCCDESFRLKEENLKHYHDKGWHIFRGGDWGTKTKKSYTYTVDVVYDRGKWRIIWAKRYEGGERDYSYCLPKITNEFRNYCTLGGFDQGIGFAQNDILTFAIHNKTVVPSEERKIFPILYSGNQDDLIKWKEAEQLYVLNRTKSLNGLFQMIKRNEIIFPCWEDMHVPHFMDILNIHKEFRTSDRIGERVMYSVNPELTDDFAHALNFAIQVGKRFYGVP